MRGQVAQLKLVLAEQKYLTDPVGKLPSPHVVNLITDPQEREALNLPYLHSWTVTHFNRLLAGYQASVKREPPIPAGAPLDYEPGGHGGPEDVEGAGPAPTRG